ncbi:hypothetical protein L7F22_016535 [Adiantum nelumboides]|nr:hypothetical protein [Adiantum nelumboides]
MPLNDVTNVPANSSRGRSPGIFLCLPQEYVPTKKTCLGTLPSANERRAQGEKNVDLWIEGCLYPKDPSLNVHLPFTNIPSLLQYVGNGEQGLLGYCKRLNKHEIARSEIYLHHWQLLNESFHNLQDQMQTITSALEDAKSTIATKENVIKKLEDTLSHMKSTAMGGRVRKRELSEIQTLAPHGGARKQRVVAMRNFVQETCGGENASARASLLRSCFNKEDFIGMLDAPEAKHLKDTITKRVLSDFSNIFIDLDVQDICDAVWISTKGILTYRLHEKVIKVHNVKPLPPPPPKVLSNAYTLFFDGAFRRATGKAGGGLVLVNPEGEVVMKEQVTLDGSTSNNEAEYDILISGLKICLAQKIRRLMVKGDALLILYHIPRKENEDADLLAQQAVSNQDKAHVVIAAIALKDPQYAGMESLTPVVNYILEGEFPKEFTTGQRRKLIKQASTFLWLEGSLYQKGKDLVCRRVPSTNEIPKILKGLHEEACGGHFSHELTLKKVLLAGYVWLSMHADVQHWCRSCHNCQVNGNKKLLYGPRQAVIANVSFEKWGIDAMGPLPRTANGKLYILVAIDYMTRWIEAQSVAKVNEKTVSKFVYTHICCRFDTPLEIVSDNGPGFRRGLLTEVCEELKISHRHSTPYYPQSNGLVEKANGIITGIIRKMVESKPKRWDNFLDGAIWAYRTTYRDATQFTPFHLVYGQEALQPIELNIPTIKLTGRQEQSNDEAWIDRLLNLVELE